MMKPELKSGSGSGKVGHHDVNANGSPKKFRLRAASADLDVYGKYFKSSFAKKISYAQIVLALLIAAIQISTLSLMKEYTGNETFRSGIFASIFVGFAAGSTILASHKPTYCKLHTGMALNIIALLSHLFLVLVGVTDGIPSLRNHFSEAVTESKVQKDLEARLQDISRNNMDTTLYDHLYTEYQINLANTESVSLAATNLILTAIMSLAGVFQVILSFLMAIMTSRAICCGRTNLEGRFFELDPTHLGNVLNYRGRSEPRCGGAVAVTTAAVKKSVASTTDEKEESMEEVTLSSSPPSYEASSSEGQSSGVKLVDIV